MKRGVSMTILETKLAELSGKDIIVVQIDERAFKGRLVEFDSEALVLQDVLEADTEQPRWKIPTMALPRVEETESSTIIYRVDKVVIRLATVARIWTETREAKKPTSYIIRQKSAEE